MAGFKIGVFSLVVFALFLFACLGQKSGFVCKDGRTVALAFECQNAASAQPTAEAVATEFPSPTAYANATVAVPVETPVPTATPKPQIAIQGFETTYVDPGTASFYWRSTEFADGKISYWELPRGMVWEKKDSNLGYDHYADINALKRNTTYRAKATSCTVDNRCASAEIEFFVPAS